MGRLDPKTGKIREFRLSTPDSGPHGLVADKEGHIWFTANYKGYVGKLSPSAGDIVEYRMPDPAAKDPHSLAFDQSGILWLTFEASNFIGRLDPRTGAVRLITVTHQPFAALRHRGDLTGHSVLLRIRLEQTRLDRSEYHGDH